MRVLSLLFLSIRLASGCDFTIQGGNCVDIKISGIPAFELSPLNGSYRVGPDGNLRLWEVGLIKASGLTFEELERAIEEAFVRLEIYQAPKVFVHRSRLSCGKADSTLSGVGIEVEGDVERLGHYPYERELTIDKLVGVVGLSRGSWGPVEVRVQRDQKWYQLFPVTQDRFGIERLYPGDRVEFSLKSPWHWMNPRRAGPLSYSVRRGCHF